MACDLHVVDPCLALIGLSNLIDKNGLFYISIIKLPIPGTLFITIFHVFKYTNHNIISQTSM